MLRGTTPTLLASYLPGLTMQKKISSDAAPMFYPEQ